MREAIRTAIIQGELVPGQLYSVQTLATAFGVSRTPVREALIELTRSDMVRFERNRGVRILVTSAHDVQEIFELRIMLEVPAIFSAATRAGTADVRAFRDELKAMEQAVNAGDDGAAWRHDRRFHALILGLSGNERLVEYVDRLRDLILTRGITTAGTSRSFHDIIAEHGTILDRIDEHDAPGAAAAMRAHLVNTGNLLLGQLGSEGADLGSSWAAFAPSE